MPNYLIALIPIALIALWFGLAVGDAGALPNVEKWVNEPGNFVRLATWLIALVVVAITLVSPSDTLLGSLRTEAISTAFAVIVINELGIYRAALQERRSIIEQMGSPVHDAALEAVRLTRKNGWLTDDSLKGATLWGANLQGANLMEAKLQGANLMGANLQDADLGEAKLQGVNLMGAKLQGANLMAANLQDADLWGAKLQGANLMGANLQDANLKEANFQGANLMGANLQDVDLWGARLQGVNLTGAKLQGATLLEANLQDADLRRALYNNETTWLDGFDPVAAFALLVDAEPGTSEADFPA